VLRKEQLVGNEAVVPFSVRDFRDFASQTRTLEGVAGAQYDGAWPATMRDGDRVLSPNTAVVSGNYFSTLGARPAVGRMLMETDDVVGGDAIAISYSLWQRAFGGDSAVVGRVLHGAGSGKAFRIVGVMPRGFAFPGKAEVWVPTLTVMPARPRTKDSGRTIWLVGCAPASPRIRYARSSQGISLARHTFRASLVMFARRFDRSSRSSSVM
jgi:hypothetical protein